MKLFPPCKDEQNSARDWEQDEHDPGEDSKGTPGIPPGLNKFEKEAASIKAPNTVRMIPPTILVRQAT
jgi:hypothetical protein